MKGRLYKFWVLLVIAALVQGACKAVLPEEETPVEEEPVATEQVSPDEPLEPTIEPDLEPTEVPQVPSTGGDTWLVMMYQDADDGALEGGAFFDLNEAELVGSSDQVKIVSQLDRYEGAFNGDGDWTSTRRYFVTQDNFWDSLGSELVEDLGEVDSGSKDSLVDFAIWAIQTYPADRYVLVLSDHGSGWLGALSDDVPTADARMTTNQIDQALAEIISATGIGQFELVGFDACLMAQIEVLSGLAPYARYAVASQENEPALGWAYTDPLAALSANPAMSGAELAKLFVDTYIVNDLMIVNDDVRQLLLAGKDLPLDTSADELVANHYQDTTMSAFDLSALAELHQATNDLALALQEVDQGGVAQARAYAQMFSQIFIDAPPHFMDLGHFTSLLVENFPSDSGIQQSVQGVQAALQKVVIAEKHGSQRAGATGVTIYFPNSELYVATTGPEVGSHDYSGAVARFSSASLWDDFLRYHYTGVTYDSSMFDLTVLNPVSGPPVALVTPVPEAPGPVDAPGAGQIAIQPLTLSAEEITNEETVTVSTDIQGTNIAYVYFYVFLEDEESGSFLLMDADYADAENVREVNGVYFPDYGTDSFTLNQDWSPTVFYLNNGTDEIFALFEPDTYGLGAEDTFYRVNGYYTFADTGERLYSQMYFNANGDFNGVWVYPADANAAAREVYPTAGDQFTVIENWLEFDQNPDGEFLDYDGGTLEFTDEPMRFIAYAPRGGLYVFGIAVEDMDGNLTYQMIGLTVTE